MTRASVGECWTRKRGFGFFGTISKNCSIEDGIRLGYGRLWLLSPRRVGFSELFVIIRHTVSFCEYNGEIDSPKISNPLLSVPYNLCMILLLIPLHRVNTVR